MPLTPEQLELRRTGITSTDISAICGLNPYKSPMEVYLDKVGKSIEREDTEAMWWGREMEPVIARRYVQGAGRCVWLAGATMGAPPVLATPDAFVHRQTRGGTEVYGTVWSGLHVPPDTDYGLELKTAFSASQVRRWGHGGDAVPEEYLVQCAWCMAVTDLDRWDIAVLLAGYNGAEFRTYTLARDRVLERALIERAEAFWRDHVEARKPPPPDGSASALRALKNLYPQDETPIAPATDTVVGLADELRLAEAEYAEAAAERERIRQELMAEVKTAEGTEGRIGDIAFKVTWKTDKRGRRVFRPWFSKEATDE